MSPLDPVAEIAFIPELRRFGRITGGLPQRVGVGGRCTVLAEDGRRLSCEVPADRPPAQLTALLEAPR